MANDYFNNLVALVRRTEARAEALNSILNAIKSGFDLFPSKTRLYEQRVSYGTDAGVANAYVVTVPYTFTLTDGAEATFLPLNTNTGASVININGLGNVAAADFSGTAVAAGAIVGDAFLTVRYHAVTSTLRIVSPLVSIGSVSVNNNVKGDATDAVPGTLDAKLTVSGGYLVKTIVDAAGNRTVNIALVVDEGQLALQAELFS